MADILSYIIYDGTTADADTYFYKFLAKGNLKVLNALNKCDFKLMLAEAQQKIEKYE